MILDRIVENKRLEIREEMAAVPLAEVRGKALKARPPLDFKAAISRRKGCRSNIIAEIKRQSPSMGSISRDFDPQGSALKYARGGAAAISVLTDEKFFGGSRFHLQRVRQVSSLPLLAKDFILHPYQIYANRRAGADAVLLITRILGRQQLAELYGLAVELGMNALVEVHDAKDMERAQEINAEIIGINNRDLGDFSLDLKVTERLMKGVASGSIIVSASGINTRKDLLFLEGLGVDAVLVGTALMRSSDPEKELCRLRGGNCCGSDQDVRNQKP